MSTVTDVGKARAAAAPAGLDLTQVPEQALRAELARRYDAETLNDEGAFRDIFDSGPEGIEDGEALVEARLRLQRREYRECLYQLQKALGRDFDGLAELTPEQLA